MFTGTTLLTDRQNTITNSMEQSPSWESNSFSASQSPCILWDPKIHYHACNSPLLAHSVARLIQYTPSHLISLWSILTLSFHLCLGLQNGLFPTSFPTKTSYEFLFFPITPHALPTSSFVWSLWQYIMSRWAAWTVTLLTIKLSPASCYFLPLRSTCVCSTLFSNTNMQYLTSLYVKYFLTNVIKMQSVALREWPKILNCNFFFNNVHKESKWKQKQNRYII
jgi:hypothetical protein